MKSRSRGGDDGGEVTVEVKVVLVVVVIDVGNWWWWRRWRWGGASGGTLGQSRGRCFTGTESIPPSWGRGPASEPPPHPQPMSATYPLPGHPPSPTPGPSSIQARGFSTLPLLLRYIYIFHSCALFFTSSSFPVSIIL